MHRPGYLDGFIGMVPRRGTFRGLSGKGDFEPPPAPPPGEIPLPTPPGPPPKTIENYLRTHQDNRCPEGERITTIPCQGADCDPGETEGDCQDDPLYLRIETPQPPRGAAEQAELEQLETEAAAVSAMPKVAVMAPPSAYTGGGMPTGLPRRARKRAPTREQQVESIVSEFETRGAIRRTRGGARFRAPSPKLAPIPPPTQEPVRVVVESEGGLFAWLRNAFFGDYEHDGSLSSFSASHPNYEKLAWAGRAVIIVVSFVLAMGIYRAYGKT